MASTWNQETGIWDAAQYFRSSYQKSAYFSNHFIMRLYQRFEIAERQRIMEEVVSLIKYKMYSVLFDSTEPKIKVMVNNNVTVICAMQDHKLELVTIYGKRRKKKKNVAVS